MAFIATFYPALFDRSFNAIFLREKIFSILNVFGIFAFYLFVVMVLYVF